MIDQNSVFVEGEADAYYRRNAAHNAQYRIEDDIVAASIEASGRTPHVIYDFGCSSGERLEALCHRYHTTGFGVDASSEAIEAADKRDAEDLRWYVGDWVGFPPYSEPDAGCVITSYVWHWVDRCRLFEAAQTVDAALAPGGTLIINDFWPDTNTRREYHHLTGSGVYTYKQNYAALFLSAGTYRLEAIDTYPYHGDATELGACVRLVKDTP